MSIWTFENRENIPPIFDSEFKNIDKGAERSTRTRVYWPVRFSFYWIGGIPHIVWLQFHTGYLIYCTWTFKVFCNGYDLWAPHTIPTRSVGLTGDYFWGLFFSQNILSSFTQHNFLRYFTIFHYLCISNSCLLINIQ